MRQELINDHVGRASRLLDKFSSDYGDSINRISDTVSSFLRRSLFVEDGLVAPTPGNASVLRNLDPVFHHAVNESGHDDLVSSFVSLLPGQVPEFEQLYSEMRSDVPSLPESLRFSDQNIEMFGVRAALSVSAFDASTRLVMAGIRKLGYFALGRVPLEDYVAHVLRPIHNMSNVRGNASDILYSFFRGVAEAAYDGVDPSGDKLLVSYVGSPKVSQRAFCTTQLAAQPKTLADVRKLDNGQLPNSLGSCGGFGCDHYWLAVGTR